MLKMIKEQSTLTGWCYKHGIGGSHHAGVFFPSQGPDAFDEEITIFLNPDKSKEGSLAIPTPQ